MIDEMTLKDNKINTLTIDCDDIVLRPTYCDLTIPLPIEKIKQFDTLIINGIKFIQEKSE